jgi:hypothetical protein
MEIILALVAIAVLGAIAWYYWPRNDVNNDGKVNTKDVKDQITDAVTSVVDVNRDGAVNKDDAKKAVEVTASKVKKTAAKVERAVKPKTPKATIAKAKKPQ